MSNYIITINNIKKNFDDFYALKGINLNIEEGQIFGILGPNGAGKSTLIRIICAILEPSFGNAFVMDMDVVKDSEKIKENIGYMSQKFSLYNDLTVLENLRFYSEIYKIDKSIKKDRIEKILKLSSLEDKKNTLAKNLSGGLKQRLALGCSIIHKPKILILDEPTSAVDPVSRRLFWSIIYDLSKEGITILVTTHYMDEALTCDEVVFLFKGQIIGQGNPTELIKEHNVSNLEDLFIKYSKQHSDISVNSSFTDLKFFKEGE
ncbi:MAG: ABC transporter ATP-binding protein [Peptostreptococcaceae bacterium]|jgi:ABC-2 type transport system ATP-binding protein|nr:ABC transporter ATP-binding protein [Peptostreptococcaceae bacterium]